MSSYYSRVYGNLEERKIARVADVNLMQTNVTTAISTLINDLHGPHFIIGGEKEALEVVPTTDVIDQSNYNHSEDENQQWISFYDRYFRQSIYITKSSIESITVHMENSTEISPTIYAEIRDTDFSLVAESSIVLEPTNPNESEDTRYNTTFNFNKDHIPVGHYYFVIRPVDISETDFASSNYTDTYNSILPDNFRVRYDIDGTYHKSFNNKIPTSDDEEEIVNIAQGLEASYDSSNYLDATLLEEMNEIRNLLDADDPNIDLYFEEAYSSGLTFLIKPGEAIVFGEKVDSFDTHVKLNAPSSTGDRTDLIVLRNTGVVEVIPGSEHTGERVYPNDDNGLKLAYVTVYQNNSKPILIEQDDENGMTRHRDLLERMRRVENKLNYQVTYNSPSRIKYNCEVDPIMFNDGLAKNLYDKENAVFEDGSYGMGLDVNDDGQNIITNNEALTYIWSIIKGVHRYPHEEKKTIEGYCRVFNVDTLNNKGTPTEVTNGLYKAKVSTHTITSKDPSRTLQNPIKGVTVKVVVKSGKTQKYAKTLTTNSKGEATLNLNKAKLSSGKTYQVHTTVGNASLTTTFKVHKDSYRVSNPGSQGKKVTITTTEKVNEKEDIRKDGIIFGNDYFETSNVNVDVDKGIIELAKIDTSKDKYVKNSALSTDKKNKNYYNSDIHEYKIHSNKNSLKSEFPVLHLSFDRDTQLKSITPYIKKFKNIDSLGILLFKNDQILNMKQHKRKLVEKKFKNDVVYPNIYQASIKLKGTKTGKDGVQTIDSNITFKPKKVIKLESGTYTLMLYGKLKDTTKDGALYLREFDTYGNLEKYGMSAKCTGSSNLSLLKMSTNNLTSRSWNVIFEQKPDKYVETGVVTSTAKNVGKQINSCSIRKNIIDNNGSYKLEVSNNGGANWIDATSLKDGGSIQFNGTGTVLKWRLTLHGDTKHTPQLYYSEKKKYAIKITMNVENVYVPYEDFKSCYTTPIFNANTITNTYVIDPHTRSSFEEWEFARLYMLDDDNSSNVDICFSYDYDDYSTNVSTLKNDWKSDTFFSTIFADLKLSDFSTTSVDYDNYDNNVEFDEHNFSFKMKSEGMMHNSAGVNVASPHPTIENDSAYKYEYGNINNADSFTKVSELFTYEYITHDYTYYMNDDIEGQQHAGAHLLEGPYYSAKFLSADTTKQKESLDKVDEDEYPNLKKYIINGISFNEAFKLDENNANLTLDIFVEPGTTTFTETELDENGQPKKNEAGDEIKITTTRQSVFPSNTFSIVISLTDDGTISETDDTDPNNTIITPTGIAIPITTELGFDIIKEIKEGEGETIKGVGKFNRIEMDLTDYVEQFSNSGIRSIGLRVNKPENIHKNDVIGLGLLNAGYYNRRPYVSYIYPGTWDRLKWKRLNNNARFYNIIGGYGESKNTQYVDGKYFKFFYPTYRDTKISENESDNLMDNSNEIDGFGYAHKPYGTSMWLERDNVTQSSQDNEVSTRGKYPITSITRKNNVFTANINIMEGNTTSSQTGKISASNSGNELLFIFPAETGAMFKIDTDIPLNLYDLASIEYYVYHDNVLNRDANPETKRDSTNKPTYKCEGNGSGDNEFHNYTYYGSFSKGDILFKLYDKVDITDTEPIETFALPSWGRTQQNATIKDKSVNAWFKIRNNATRIKSIVIERQNPHGGKAKLGELRLVLQNMLFHNTDSMPALGPQMLMRVYPKADLNEIQIRKSGCIYRI